MNIVDAIIKVKWLILGSVVLLLTGAGALSWWSNVKDKRSIEAGNIMYKALMSNVDQAKMISMLQSVIDGDFGNYKYLAKLRLASTYGIQDIEKAQEIYASLVNDEKVVPELKELAGYLEVISLLKGSNVDLLKEKVGKLIVQNRKVYQSSVKEVAAITRIKDDDIKGAMEIMQEIVSDVNSDSMISKNAKDLMRIYSKK
ncbi:hypothetical protein [Candidatus Neoehrlichia procyonis]|uniref:Tetratricopeptide repeat-like domain-containing protein n=1 Tax=Candidatus Neoehrlichia procyonis str. RAC413 TaxID=1359163 RepID=A0A0F3NPP1_9RICK|nr:hypothetical protein [Candidatus Neoehrlichia lotoris]KJV69647.1 hypothetical protein NLO413_1047 [Candidatus Neoehrlichia lotoris str. RAC413]